jgi:4-alpha-glucanotransferase
MERKSGILMHVTSLPSSLGIGDLGPKAYEFADILKVNKQSLWQVLPLNPTDPAHDNSPYRSISTFAGNTLLISSEVLIEKKLLSKNDLEPIPQFKDSYVEFENVVSYKYQLYRRAFENFKNRSDKSAFEYFIAENSSWLNDFALFVALKHNLGNIEFVDWPEKLKKREPNSIERVRRDLSEEIKFEQFLQFEFYSQWFSLKDYCNKNGVLLIGDIPIYVDADSTDVWVEPFNFKLDNNMRPTGVSGVPPDYFSATGQLWGNPVYDWNNLKNNGFDWWKRRIGNALRLFDFVRIDHFRGLVAYWEVPYGEKTAINGRWKPVPTFELFGSLKEAFPNSSLIAEDSGVITNDVGAVMKRFGFPGMKVLLFAFGGGADNPYNLPYNFERNFVVYTGTHDNNTVRGWFENEATVLEKENFEHYIGKNVDKDSVNFEMIKLAQSSVASFAIIPLQDVLGLGASARMNIPSTVGGNWRFKLASNVDLAPYFAKLRELTEVYGRS